MFEQSVVEARGLAARPWTLAASMAAQMALISVAMVFPMIHPEVLQRVSLWVPVISPPHGYHPPAAQKVDATRVVTARRVFHSNTLYEPATVPETVKMLVDPPPEVVGAGAGSGEGVPGGVDFSGLVSPVISGVSTVPQMAPPKPTPAVVKQPAQIAPTPTRINVSTGVQAALLIYGPKPPYPVLARQARIQGSVHLAAVISNDGRILDLRATDGHPLLVGAAVDAVKRWVYRPTLLNGVPVEVVTEITVTFKLQ